MTNCKNNNSEQGVAVIIALGILALILALGLNFASQSIINEKAAQNVNDRIKADLQLNSSKNIAIAAATACLNADIELDNFYSSTDSSAPLSYVKYDETDSEIKVISEGITFYGNSNTQWKDTYDKDNKLISRLAFTLVR